MPFVPLNPAEQKKWPEPCRHPEHYPPTHIVITERMKWECPACHRSVILEPTRVYMSAVVPEDEIPVTAGVYPKRTPQCGLSTRRTKAEVLRQRREGKGGSGCCERYANMQGCDCLNEAVTVRCATCKDLGYTGTPDNLFNRDVKRCPRGCPVRCSVCSNPDCDNPNGQH